MTEQRIVLVYGDGVHDDTEAMQAIVNGDAVAILPNGRPLSSSHATVRIARTLQVTGSTTG